MQLNKTFKDTALKDCFSPNKNLSYPNNNNICLQMVLTKSVLILNENETMRLSVPLPGNPSRQTRMQPALLPKGRNSQFTHVLGTSTSRLQSLSHVRSQKSTYIGKLRHTLHLQLPSCSAQTRQWHGGAATPAQQDLSMGSLTSPPPRPDRNITSSLPTLKDVSNSSVSKHVHAFSWYNRREYVFELTGKSLA